MEKHQTSDRLIQAATVCCVITGLLFWALFQLSKQDAVQAIDPFAEDPYDAVDSIAGEAAVALAILSAVRLIRVITDPQTAPSRVRYILRGDAVVLAAVGVSLITDASAFVLNPGVIDTSINSQYLIGGLLGMTAVVVISAVMLIAAWRSTPLSLMDAAGSLGEAVDDMVHLIGLPVAWITGRRIDLLAWWKHIERSTLFTWISPDAHPWRFTAITALAVAAVLLIGEWLVDGPPPSLAIALVLIAIFMGVELVAVLGGFLLLGGYLGIRPPLKR